MLLFRITRLLLNWKILSPPDKKDLLELYINRIKAEVGKILWLPFGHLNTTWSFIKVMKEWPGLRRSMKNWWRTWNFHGGACWTSLSTLPKVLILMLRLFCSSCLVIWMFSRFFFSVILVLVDDYYGLNPVL